MIFLFFLLTFLYDYFSTQVGSGCTKVFEVNKILKIKKKKKILWLLSSTGNYFHNICDQRLIKAVYLIKETCVSLTVFKYI